MWLFSKNVPALFQRLTVELTSNTSVLLYLRGSTALESNCLTSIFYQPSLKKLWRSRRTAAARGVWFGSVVLSVIRLAASGHSELPLFALVFVSPSVQFLLQRGGERFTCERNGDVKRKRFSPQNKHPSAPTPPFIFAKMFSKTLEALCVLFHINKSSLC